MKPNEDGFLNRMFEAYELSQKDPEGAHIDADEILIDIAKRAGYEKTAELFDEMCKWYA